MVRFKHRWFLVEVCANEALPPLKDHILLEVRMNCRQIQHLLANVHKWWGEWGIAGIRNTTTIAYVSPTTRTFIIKAAHVGQRRRTHSGLPSVPVGCAYAHDRVLHSSMRV